MCGFGASSRNGGFCDASLTHGFLNGLAHWPDDLPTLERLGAENLEAILHTIDRYEIPADAHRVDEVFATATGDRWETRLRDNRIELVREEGEFRIISGI